jgi:hypothetical protein
MVECCLQHYLRTALFLLATVPLALYAELLGPRVDSHSATGRKTTSQRSSVFSPNKHLYRVHFVPEVLHVEALSRISERRCGEDGAVNAWAALRLRGGYTPKKSRKSMSKRKPLRLKYKIVKKVAEHHRRLRRKSRQEEKDRRARKAGTYVKKEKKPKRFAPNKPEHTRRLSA